MAKINLKRLFLIYSATIIVSTTLIYAPKISNEYSEFKHAEFQTFNRQRESSVRECLIENLGDSYKTVETECRKPLLEQETCYGVVCVKLSPHEIFFETEMNRCMQQKLHGVNCHTIVARNEVPENTELKKFTKFLEDNAHVSTWRALGIILFGIALFPIAVAVKRWLYVN